ncbi:hypothetical protein [Variovorax sp. LG9.2]|uniref:hypothetical protein n=1 Tax=Variovorax sp. LG9.2 TaxID=3048626 RepID=UPI002B223B80|nr:hypothetical protein [Variovorax sp. LG9.2]MEB0057288.1 hypothetical protein [Variovorax sp. LG9.2]
MEATKTVGRAPAYTPNIKDKRVLKRLQTAYGYARAVFDEVTPTPKSQLSIAKRFGQAQDALGQFLRAQLLVCVDHHYSHAAGVSKKYTINIEGAALIKEVLYSNKQVTFTPVEVTQIDNSPEPRRYFDEFVVIKMLEQEHKEELESKDFKYEDKASRLWNALQSVKSCYKRPLLEKYGFNYHYDIRCCAPTLIHQHAQQVGQMDEYLFGIQGFLKDRTAFRDMLTADAELEEFGAKTSKILVNALFCGARLGNSKEFALSRLLNHDKARIEFLKQHDELTQLRADIKTCWKAITPLLPRRYINDKNGTCRRLPVSSKQKWCVYFELERRVLDAARMFMKKTDNKCFLEHDGWSTEKQIDVPAMQAFIEKQTGFKIEVDTEFAAAAHQRAIEPTPELSLCSVPRESIAFLKRDDHLNNSLPLIPHVYEIFCAAPKTTTWLQQFIKRKQLNEERHPH